VFLVNHYTVHLTRLKTTSKLAFENDNKLVHDFRFPSRCK